LDRIEVYFDGSSQPAREGRVARYGFVIYRDGRPMIREGGVVRKGGDATNNVAEYTALIKALERLKKEGLVGEITVYGDSELVIRHLKGVYAVRSERLRSLYEKALGLIHELGARVEWVPREKNTEADALSKGSRT
jgi:ribonuclease HI